MHPVPSQIEDGPDPEICSSVEDHPISGRVLNSRIAEGAPKGETSLEKNYCG